MNAPDDNNEEHTEEQKAVRVTHEETYNSIRPSGTGSRRNLVLTVAAVAVFAIVVIVFAFYWLRPAAEVKTEAPAAPGNTGTVKFLM